MSRLIAPGAFTDAGYDDSGRLLDLVATGSYGPHRVIDLETGSRVGTLKVEGEATWVGEGVMALLGDWGLELGTVGAGLTQPEDPVLRRAESVFPGYTTDRAWAAVHVRGQAGSVLHEFDVASATTTGRVVRVPGDPTQLRSTDAGRTLLVGYLTSSTPLSYGYGDHYRAALFGVGGGRSRDVPAYESAVAETDGGIGRIVVADTLGRMEELDPDHPRPHGRAARVGRDRPLAGLRRRRVPVARDRGQQHGPPLRRRHLDPGRIDPGGGLGTWN